MAKQSVREYLARIDKGLLDTSAGGVLDNGYQEKFIADVLDFWPFLQGINFINNISSANYELNEMSVGDKAMRKPTAGTEPAESELTDWTITPHVLTVSEGSLYADIAKNFLLRNVMKEDVETVLVQKLAEVFGANFLNLAINGDTAYDGAASDEAFFQIADGWLKKMKADSAVNVFDTDASADYKGVVFPGMLALLPERHRFNQLYKPEIFMNIADYDDYVDQVAERETPTGDRALLTADKLSYKGLPVSPMPYWPAGHVLMTTRKNLAAGIWEKMTRYREYKPRLHVLQFTFDGQFGFGYEQSGAIVLGYNEA